MSFAAPVDPDRSGDYSFSSRKTGRQVLHSLTVSVSQSIFFCKLKLNKIEVCKGEENEL
jgi:hypothetical protein